MFCSFHLREETRRPNDWPGHELREESDIERHAAEARLRLHVAARGIDNVGDRLKDIE